MLHLLMFTDESEGAPLTAFTTAQEAPNRSPGRGRRCPAVRCALGSPAPLPLVSTSLHLDRGSSPSTEGRLSVGRPGFWSHLPEA